MSAGGPVLVRAGAGLRPPVVRAAARGDAPVTALVSSPVLAVP